jgi:hypothetical protein
VEVKLALTYTQVAKAIRCPVDAVALHWPLIEECMDALEVGSRPSKLGMLATVAVETANKFQPIREMGGASYLATKKYWPYYGRGFIQTTWLENYQAGGKALGIDLVGNPDHALDPSVSASLSAMFWREHKCHVAADAGDWVKVRKLVNGGTNGLQAFLFYVQNLLAEVTIQ